MEPLLSEREDQLRAQAAETTRLTAEVASLVRGCRPAVTQGTGGARATGSLNRVGGRHFWSMCARCAGVGLGQTTALQLVQAEAKSAREASSRARADADRFEAQVVAAERARSDAVAQAQGLRDASHQRDQARVPSGALAPPRGRGGGGRSC